MDSCNQTCEEYFLTVRKLLISGNFNELFTASFTASGIKPHKQNNIFRMTENCWMLNLKQKKNSKWIFVSFLNIRNVWIRHGRLQGTCSFQILPAWVNNTKHAEWMWIFSRTFVEMVELVGTINAFADERRQMGKTEMKISLVDLTTVKKNKLSFFFCVSF